MIFIFFEFFSICYGIFFFFNHLYIYRQLVMATLDWILVKILIMLVFVVPIWSYISSPCKSCLLQERFGLPSMLVFVCPYMHVFVHTHMCMHMYVQFPKHPLNLVTDCFECCLCACTGGAPTIFRKPFSTPLGDD